MGKPVRDRIPEIIRQSGRTSHVTIVDEQIGSEWGPNS